SVVAGELPIFLFPLRPPVPVFIQELHVPPSGVSIMLFYSAVYGFDQRTGFGTVGSKRQAEDLDAAGASAAVLGKTCRGSLTGRENDSPERPRNGNSFRSAAPLARTIGD